MMKYKNLLTSKEYIFLNKFIKSIKILVVE